jgi:hypothetical protein
LQKRSDAPLPFRIVRGQVHEHADTPHLLRLLCVRRERPGSHRTAEQRDELAASYVEHGASSPLALAHQQRPQPAEGPCSRFACRLSLPLKAGEIRGADLKSSEREPGPAIELFVT